MHDLFLEITSLQYQVKSLRHQVESFKSGQRYLKMQEDYRRVMAGYEREIKRLKNELADAHAETRKVRDIWYDQSQYNWKQYLKDISKKNDEILRLTEQNHELIIKYDARNAALRDKYEKQLEEKDAAK